MFSSATSMYFTRAQGINRVSSYTMGISAISSSCTCSRCEPATDLKFPPRSNKLWGPLLVWFEGFQQTMSLLYILIWSAAAACAARLPRQPPQPLLNSNDIFRRRSGGPLYGNDTDDSPYWLGNLLHQGKAPFHMTRRNYTGGNDTVGNCTTGTYIATNGTGRNITERYLVFRNVKDYGARGKPMFFF